MAQAARAWTWALGGVALASAGMGLLVKSTLYVPDDIEPVAVQCERAAPTLRVGDTLTVLVWNVQYSAGRSHRFFYDGGDAVHVPAADVVHTLDRIAEVVREVDPDIILWQEIDRGSDRTARIDQYAELLQRLSYPCHTSTPYHRASYVPHPPAQHMGKVDMNLAVFSRYQLEQATRHQLPLLAEPWWRQAFNLRRAVLEVTVAVDGAQPLQLFNTHLSAFSKGDGTLGRQIASLDGHMTRAEQAGAHWVLAGDLNALPPGDDPARLGDEAIWYAESASPVLRLFDRFSSVVPRRAYEEDPQTWRTYVPFGSQQADRTLDYAFVGRKVAAQDTAVIQALDVSDHLPLTFHITLE